ncbi:hypothetical protein ACN42_g9788 [Penicillium freii]|uniref:Uncharacterized protein n=1 Tax=Penicillium freii TaxID=48697 RepID=A0A101MBB3_PENFR|nr:hypothetical protein ACN42_g9788 [Penicillium freii]
MSKKKKSLPRGIEPRSPALIGINDKRKSSPLDQGRYDGRVTARPLGWLMGIPGYLHNLFYHEGRGAHWAPILAYRYLTSRPL